MSFSVANYEPRQQMPLTLRSVVTPGNNLGLFKERQKMARDAKIPQLEDTMSQKGMMKPGGRLAPLLTLILGLELFGTNVMYSWF